MTRTVFATRSAGLFLKLLSSPLFAQNDTRANLLFGMNQLMVDGYNVEGLGEPSRVEPKWHGRTETHESAEVGLANTPFILNVSIGYSFDLEALHRPASRLTSKGE
jgi:hypothetical protein